MVLLYASCLAEGGHEVTVETNSMDTVLTMSKKIRIGMIALKGKLGTLIWALWRKSEADIVIADIIPLAVLLFTRNRRRVIYFAQDYNVTHYKNPFMKALVIMLNYIAFSLFHIRAIAVSEGIARFLSEKYNAKTVKVIPNGIDTTVFYPAPSEVLKAEKSGRRAILVLSRSDQRKGFDIAQQVVVKLRTTCAVPFEIWTVGEAAEGAFGDVPHRHFGYVQEKEMRSLFSSADLFLYPSRSEGYPLMVVEAFACRCPVVTTEAVPYAITGINAMVSKVGDVDSLADQVCRVMRSSELAEAIAAHGHAYAHAHTLQSAKNAFENTLKEFCEQQRHD